MFRKITCVLLLTTSSNCISTSGIESLSQEQIKILRLAKKHDGRADYVVPAIFYKETKAGEIVEHPKYVGLGQIAPATVREIIAQNDEISKVCRISAKSSNQTIKKAVNANPTCSVLLTSEYLNIISTRYKIHGIEQQLVAYNMGPIKAKKVKTSKYARDVLHYMDKLRGIV